MEELLDLLKDGHARTKEMLALELGTSIEDIERKLEFLENIGTIKRIDFQMSGCNCDSCESCTDEGNHTCPGCLPEGGFKNMGIMWEVV
ncbi:MAG: hypothetical protein K6F66_05650 [Pseudobutyrivibrio sp.]|nr:hypothetical protein [Pseudobutyrivibrio sp.]